MSDDAKELLDRVQSAYADGNYNEELFSESVQFVLNHHGIEYKTEKRFDDSGGQGFRMADLYVPRTDTAIELKTSASLRGVGQCAFYAEHCSESILMADGDPATEYHNQAVADACRHVDDVHYSLCIPGPAESPPMFDITTTSRPKFYTELLGAGGHSDMAVFERLENCRSLVGAKNE